MEKNQYLKSFISTDWKSGIAVFLVALPLCLGIALASGAPLIAGLIAGIVGGTVVAILSGSELSVSGPAAGLTILVFNAIQSLNSYSTFLLAVVLAGLIQIGLSLLKLGKIGSFFPSSVIRGMLVAIGIVIILKQIPHALGDDFDFIGEFEFFQQDGNNTFGEIMAAFSTFKPGAIIISISGLFILSNWTKAAEKLEFLKNIPASLIVVLLGIFANFGFKLLIPDWYLGDSKDHMVNLPNFASFGDFLHVFQFPDFSALNQGGVYKVALTLAIVASLETLLSLEATDSLDPQKRISSADKELLAQGIGNVTSGLIGGIPLTSVIVRSSTNIYAGAKTRMSGILHGILLLISVLFLSSWMNLIPLACLASVLLYTGYKLAHPKEFKKVLSEGWKQWVPFLTTIVVVVFVDLLWGIFIGTSIGLLFVIFTSYESVITVHQKENSFLIRFKKDVTFLHKMTLKTILQKIPENSLVFIDAKQAHFMDHDIQLMLKEYMETANLKNIEIDYQKTHERI
ncbi:SulP family inorganic anion transporter [Sandaracinomonas limnophila]|uniref:SulP family inorganic anion transporter n=1 Tax=Sandaracinomonas limnophila TaxID=1862386 RepID=A0A437PU76_9BACT|nr:SulP family inorganic anion transporter [Sandaracinomonas limnophila]RVU25812.1 SulP family inorganic anion transporter [Sandaracinomonas limnophila]